MIEEETNPESQSHRYQRSILRLVWLRKNCTPALTPDSKDPPNVASTPPVSMNVKRLPKDEDLPDNVNVGRAASSNVVVGCRRLIRLGLTSLLKYRVG